MTLSERAGALDALMHEIDFPKDAIDFLMEEFSRICAMPDAEKGFADCLTRYEACMHLDYAKLLADAAAAGALLEMHPYTAQLLILCLMALPLRDAYREKGIDDEIYLCSARDLTWKLLECRAVHGINGTFVAGWFPGWYRLERFGLGRLQFEKVRFGREYEKNGVRLTPDSIVLNIHIPRSLLPLSPELVEDAMARAADFYRDQLNGAPIAFVCSSWLLYGPHTEFLPPHSNLRTFMARFDLLSSHDHEAGEHPDLWRLFDCNYHGDPDALPADTSLRRAYIRRLKEGKPTGSGYGVCLWEEK